MALSFLFLECVVDFGVVVFGVVVLAFGMRRQFLCRSFGIAVTKSFIFIIRMLYRCVGAVIIVSCVFIVLSCLVSFFFFVKQFFFQFVFVLILVLIIFFFPGHDR